MKVQVLMSSYNGEKYIEEQIESILEQDEIEVRLLVRDDGSKDSTPQILERYKQQGRLEYYVGENIGWQRSFMDLVLNAPECEYYAFSDQDDYWLPEKLKKAVEGISTLPSDPNLYISNATCWKDGNIIGLVQKKKPRLDKYSSFIRVLGQGCTYLFNSQLMNIIKNCPPSFRLPHDAWFARTAALIGNVYYDFNSYILYRQHALNQLGTDTSIRDKYIRRINTYTHLEKTHYLDHFAEEIIRCYKQYLSEESFTICYNIANYRKLTKCYFTLLFSPRYVIGGFLTNLGFKYRVLRRII